VRLCGGLSSCVVEVPSSSLVRQSKGLVKSDGQAVEIF
jgi:hypothetical protein